MSTKQSSNIPVALSQARHQLDLWRSQQPNKRARFPKEYWQQAVADDLVDRARVAAASGMGQIGGALSFFGE